MTTSAAEKRADKLRQVRLLQFPCCMLTNMAAHVLLRDICLAPIELSRNYSLLCAGYGSYGGSAGSTSFTSFTEGKLSLYGSMLWYGGKPKWSQKLVSLRGRVCPKSIRSSRVSLIFLGYCMRGEIWGWMRGPSGSGPVLYGWACQESTYASSFSLVLLSMTQLQ